MDYTIENNMIKVVISDQGAEIQSVILVKNLCGKLILKFGEDMHRFFSQL